MKERGKQEIKRLAWILAMVMVLAFVPGTVRAEEDGQGTSGNLPGAETHYDSDGDSWYNIYYGYDLDGRVMFTLQDYSYDYMDESINYFPAMNFYTEEEFIHYYVLNWSDTDFPAGRYSIVESRYDKDKTTLKQYNTYSLYYSTPVEIEKASSYEPEYSEDGGSYTMGEYRYVLNENRDLTEQYQLGEDGEWVLVVSNSYDEYGNLAAWTYYDSETGGLRASRSYDEYGNLAAENFYDSETGEMTSSDTYYYEYNESGQPTRSMKVSSDGEEYETILDYFTMQDLQTVQSFLSFAGYWTREEDGQVKILEISATGLLFEGYVDEETGLIIPENYAYYEENEAGILDCEYYEYGAGGDWQEDWSADISVEISGENLIFDGKEYTPYQ